MNDVFERLSKQLEQLSPIDIDGTPFGVWLIDIREPLIPSISVDVVFGAKSLTGTHTGELHLGREHLADEGYVIDCIVETVRQIVRGELPPGTRQLL